MKIYGYNGRKNIAGRRLREARMQLEGIVIERDSVSRAEMGTRFIPDYEIPAFARVLRVSAGWLLGLEERGGPAGGTWPAQSGE